MCFNLFLTLYTEADNLQNDCHTYPPYGYYVDSRLRNRHLDNGRVGSCHSCGQRAHVTTFHKTYYPLQIFQSFTRRTTKGPSAQEGYILKTLNIPLARGYIRTVPIHSRRQSAAEVGSISLSPFMIESSGSSRTEVSSSPWETLSRLLATPPSVALRYILTQSGLLSSAKSHCRWIVIARDFLSYYSLPVPSFAR